MNTLSQSQSNTGHNNVQTGDLTDSVVQVNQVFLTNWWTSAEARLRDITSPAMFRQLELARDGGHLSNSELLRAVRSGALSERAGKPVHLPLKKLWSAVLLVLMLLPMAQLAVLLVVAWMVALPSAHNALFWLTLTTSLVSIYVAKEFYLPHQTAATVVRVLSNQNG